MENPNLKTREEMFLKQGERFDDLNRDGYLIIQNKEKFCFGMDAVLLTGFARVREGEKVLDLGTGTGVIPILLAAKYKTGSYKALEIQEESADMADRSVRYNHLENQIQIVTGDIKSASEQFAKSSFDVITCNPPYMNDRHGLKNPDLPKAIARHEVLCTLEDVVRETSKLLRPGGRFYMVHRPQRLVEIICILRQYRLEPKRMRLVHPYKDREANMVLIESARGGNPMMKVEQPLVVYDREGVYTDEIYGIYE